MDHKKKILIAEDEQPMAEVLRDTLLDEGFDAKIALDGELGLELVGSWKPDLLILDIMMPKIDGREMLQKMKADRISIPVIIVTNVSDEMEVLADAMDYGSFDYFVKANTPMSVILEKIRALL